MMKTNANRSILILFSRLEHKISPLGITILQDARAVLPESVSRKVEMSTRRIHSDITLLHKFSYNYGDYQSIRTLALLIFNGRNMYVTFEFQRNLKQYGLYNIVVNYWNTLVKFFITTFRNLEREVFFYFVKNSFLYSFLSTS